MQDAIVIKPFVADQVKNAMIHGRVIFFSAPCGFGKTTTAWALLEGKKVYFAAAGEPGFRLPLLRETWDVLLLDQPTNHLDLESIAALNNGLEAVKCNVLVSSHDHQLIQTVCNRVFDFTEDGRLIDRKMTYDEYLERVAQEAQG